MKITVQFKQQDEEEPKCTQYLSEMSTMETLRQMLGKIPFIGFQREIYAPDALGSRRETVLVAVDSIFRITEGWSE